MTSQVSTTTRLHHIFLWLSNFVFVFVMLGFIFDLSFKPLLLLGHLSLYGLVYACYRLAAKRFPDQSIGTFLVLVMLQTTFGLYQQQAVWTNYSLAGVNYAICALPMLWAIATNWGVVGLVIDLFLMGLLVSLAYRHGIGPGFSVVFSTSIGTLMGMMCHQMLYEFTNKNLELELNATTDALTKIGNRRALEQDFERYQAIGRRKGMILVLSSWDVDGLKDVNDERGHKAGDQYLMHFVRALQKGTRRGDGLYRTGGDEFVGLHMGLSSGIPIIERVRSEFASVSVGFSVFTQETLDRALSDADAQMYAEKRSRKGKNTRATREFMTRAKDRAARMVGEDRALQGNGIDINVYSTGIEISVRNTGEFPVNITKEHELSRLTREIDGDLSKTLELDPRDLRFLDKPN